MPLTTDKLSLLSISFEGTSSSGKKREMSFSGSEIIATIEWGKATYQKKTRGWTPTRKNHSGGDNVPLTTEQKTSIHSIFNNNNYRRKL